MSLNKSKWYSYKVIYVEINVCTYPVVMVFLWVVGCSDVDIHAHQSLLASAMLNPTGLAWVIFRLDEGQLQSPVISQGFGVVCQRALQAGLTCRLLNVQLTHLCCPQRAKGFEGGSNRLGRWGGRRPNHHHPSHPNAVLLCTCCGGMLISSDIAK